MGALAGRGALDWMVYFAVEDAEQATTRAQNLGATVTVPPTDIAPDGSR